MKYYKVSAKCGHVGRNNYIVKNFYVKADDGKNAAYKVRKTPRVKHDRRDAILSVDIISKSEYLKCKELQKDDPYFNVYNSSDQRRCSAVDYSMVMTESRKEIRHKNKDYIYYNKLARIMRKDLQKQLEEAI